MKSKKSNDELDALIDEIIVDAYGDDEQLWAFRQVLEDELDAAQRSLCHRRAGDGARHRL